VNKIACPEERSVVQSALTGEMPEAVSVHVASCASCREVLAAVQCMQRLARSGASDALLPDASSVWLRAQWKGEHAREARTRFAWESLALLTGASAPLAFAGWVAWRWFEIQNVAAGLLVGYLPGFAREVVTLSALVPALLFLSLISLAYPLLARD
jgi:hypothetical protein